MSAAPRRRAPITSRGELPGGLAAELARLTAQELAELAVQRRRELQGRGRLRYHGNDVMATETGGARRLAEG
jgi:hypothetical protein